MPKLILKFDDRALRECAVGTEPVSIGRRPDNMIIIDHPVVSGRHARVFREGDHYIVEDLKSTNGTFVNAKPIARHALLEGDIVLVGKHSLVFSLADAEPKTMPGHDHDRPSQMDPIVAKTAIPLPPSRAGSVRVVSGRSDRAEYTLVAMTTIIGNSETAQIRTRGWFKPKAAAAIARKIDGFTVTPMDAPVTVNGQKVTGRRELVNGDRIEVSGLTLEFRLSDEAGHQRDVLPVEAGHPGPPV